MSQDRPGYHENLLARLLSDDVRLSKRPTSAVWDIAKRAGLSTSDGLDSALWGKARDAMGLTSYRVGYLKEDIDNLTHVLSKSGPMWCAGDFLPDSSPHAIVISGYDGSKLRINDPYEI